MTRARDVADTQDNLGGAVPPFAAGKNKVINGDFGIWQRGTSFTNPTDNTYTCDRFKQNGNGTGFTKIWSRQAFTLGTAPVAGYESAYFFRFNQTVAGTGGTNNNIAIYVHEDVRTFAGQTVTLSFWAKADATRSLFLFYGQEFNGGGDQYPSIGTATLSTSWTRYTFTFTVDSIAGKTIGSGFTGNFQLVFNTANNIVQTIDMWGIQLEAGRVATPFQTATGTAQGELAACQRYYERQSLGTSNISFAGFNNSTTNGYHTWHYKVTKRTTPTIALNAATDFSVRTPAGNVQCTSFSIIGNTIDNAWISTTVASGLTTGNGNFLVNSGVSSYIEASAEL
jgi:hypothetical protein